MADICKALQSRFTDMNRKADTNFRMADAFRPNAKTKRVPEERGVLITEGNKLRYDATVLEKAYKDLCMGKK